MVRDVETPASIYYIFRAITYDSDGKFDENLLLFYLKPLNIGKALAAMPQQSLSSLSKKRTDFSGSEIQQSRYLAWEIFRALDRGLKGYLTLRDCLQRPKLTVQLLELILFQQQTQQAGPSNSSELNDSIPNFD